MAFILFILFIVFLRMGELMLSSQNEKWLLQNNAVEYGKKHYKFIIALHISFIASLIVEYYVKGPTMYSLFFILLYLILLVLKIWVVTSLGKFWNTKIYHIANVPLVKKGAYKYFKHPNYLIVIAEIAVIPLAFHLYYTAIVFSLLNLIMLYIRIVAEERALKI